MALVWSVNSSTVTLSSTSGAQVTLSAISVGTATITVRAGGTLTATATITVVQPVTSILLAPSSFILSVGGTRSITSSVLPSTAPNKLLTWSSSAPSIVTVSAAGMVTAVSAGNAIITAQSQDSGITSQATVIVSAPVSLQISMPSILNRGATMQAVANVQPLGTPVMWQSMMPSVASVSPTGQVTALSNGLTVITAQAQGRTVSAMVRVTTAATGIVLNRTTLTVPHGAVATLQATVQPTGATNTGVVWSTSRALIATVQNGVVRGVIAGQVTITAQAVDGGWIATCLVTVT